MDLRAAKAQLRAEMKARRAEVSADAHAQAAAQAAQVLLSLPQWRCARIVCLYASFKHELGTHNLLQQALGEGRVLLLPRSRPDGTLSLHEVSDLSALTASHLGILEPTPGAPIRPATEVDLFLVPGLAFDAAGHRLGYGAGFYDRLLTQAKATAFTVGYGFDFQVHPEVPVEAHDQALHAIVTPAGLVPTVSR
ncbi:MAG: 5-formyltetrahydrofolate cyclo-ligase [Opitutia bacterium AMD-G3]|jgi:5-formyltetrahydrofolate cyclo-ligase|nr:MAG: 5-formyltetrahydrofolate cyclo-ligase [Opitutae bacterium AMD-G3]